MVSSAVEFLFLFLKGKEDRVLSHGESFKLECADEKSAFGSPDVSINNVFI